MGPKWRSRKPRARISPVSGGRHLFVITILNKARVPIYGGCLIHNRLNHQKDAIRPETEMRHDVNLAAEGGFGISGYGFASFKRS